MSINLRDDLKSVPQTTPNKTCLRHVTTSHTPPGSWIWTIPNSENKRHQSWQTQVCLGLFICFICMYLHLPSICLLRPLSVPRTLPHPLQIRFQRRHTPRGEKPREQWGFRAETSRVAGDSELRLPVLSLPPAPQQQHNMVQVYKKQAWVFYEKKKNRLLSMSLLEFSRSTKSNRLRTTTVEMTTSLPIWI